MDLKKIFNKKFNSGLIERNCPLCNHSKGKILLEVDPEYFIHSNPTLDLNAIEDSGILDLSHIPLMKCSKCEMVYCKYLLNEQWNRIFWKKIFLPGKSKEKIFRHGKLLRLETLWHEIYTLILNRDPSSTEVINVLDFGCGWGDFLSIAKNDAVYCAGTEIDADKIDYCRKKGLDVYKDMNDLKNQIKFKIFFSNQVFEHLPHPRMALSQIKKHLDIDFIGIISVPNYSTEKFNTIIGEARQNNLIDKDLITWDHLNFFSPQKLFDLLDLEGFEVVDAQENIISRKSLESTTCYFRFKHG